VTYNYAATLLNLLKLNNLNEICSINLKYKFCVYLFVFPATRLGNICVGITAVVATLVGYTSGLFYGFSLRVLFTGPLFGQFIRNYCTHSVYIYRASCPSS
jgi:hypothetical protein